MFVYLSCNKMTSLAKTGLNYANFHLYSKKPSDHKANQSSRLSEVVRNPDFRLQTDEYIEENPWDVSYFLENLFLDSSVLGSGGFGVVYKATLHLPDGAHVQCVAKFNKTLLEEKFITMQAREEGSLYKCVLNDKLYQEHSDTFRQSLQSTVQEYENAVSVLNPYRNDSSLFDNSQTPKTYALKKISHVAFGKLARKIQLNETHPGFIHMHKILHFEPTVACLLSEFCDGTLLDQIFMNVNTFRGPNHQVRMEHVPPSMISFRLDHPAFMRNFLELSTQMASAIAYLRDVVHISHIDIKPENIMYISSASTLWKLSDFGLMKPFSSDTSPGLFHGTTMYMPPNLRTQFPKFSGMNVMVYQYACVLLETLTSGMDYHQISPSWNAGRDLDWGYFYFSTLIPYVRAHTSLVGKFFYQYSWLKHFTTFFYNVLHPKTLRLYVDVESKRLKVEFQDFYTFLLLQTRTSLHGD